MSGELHQLSVEIGALNANVENLTKLVEVARIESRDEHRKVHDIIDALSEAVRGLTATVKEMKPLTDDYREERAEKRGAKRFISSAYALGGAGIAVVVSKLAEWWLSIRPHP